MGSGAREVEGGGGSATRQVNPGCALILRAPIPRTTLLLSARTEAGRRQTRRNREIEKQRQAERENGRDVERVACFAAMVPRISMEGGAVGAVAHSESEQARDSIHNALPCPLFNSWGCPSGQYSASGYTTLTLRFVYTRAIVQE